MNKETLQSTEEAQSLQERTTASAPPPKLDFKEFSPETYERWKEEVVASLKGAPFDKVMYTPTYEGIQLEPLYTKTHVEGLSLPLTYPGSFPLRGNSAGGNLARLWEIVQPCDEKLPHEARAQLERELTGGATTASALLDTNTLKGLDEPSDAAGVCLFSLEDVETLFKGQTDRPLHIYAGASSAPLLGFFVAMMQKAGLPTSQLKGCIGADPMGALLEGDLRQSEELFDEMASTLKWSEAHAPQLRTVLIRGSLFHNSGASAVQEVAYAMTSAIEAMRALQKRGLDAEVFARHVRFEFSLGSNFFMEIAKLRVARSLWHQIAEAFGCEAAKAEIFARTSFFTKTVYDPYVNMLRNSTEAFSGVLAGIDGLTVGRFDEAFNDSSEFSCRISRNVQLLLQKEFNLVQPQDPAGGSWYLEALTDELAQKTWKLLQKVEAEGGFLQAVQSGTLQKEIEVVLQERFKRLARRSDRAVGTNMYPNPLEVFEAETSEAASALPARRKALEAHRAKRSAEATKELQNALQGIKAGDGELIERIAAAARAGATLGELSAVLSQGERTPPPSYLTPHRWTEQYEALRQRTEAFKARTGDNLKVFLANMGPIPQHKARADFITAFMEVAAFDVLKNEGFPTPEACADAAVQSGADVAVICSTDATYPELVPPLARAINQRRPEMKVCLAGAPKEEFRASYLEAGVDDFISVRSDCLATLTELQKAKGMF
ncbi:MAG: methylmalonyl-CoA mutase [Fretibacterium sp.]|nr:methylmalonyl-CoA mutase [Fretibacterium sp.]